MCGREAFAALATTAGSSGASTGSSGASTESGAGRAQLKRVAVLRPFRAVALCSFLCAALRRLLLQRVVELLVRVVAVLLRLIGLLVHV